jgi:hypothetical protein
VIIILVIFSVVITVGAVLSHHQSAGRRAYALADQTPALTALADTLGGELLGPCAANTWSPKLRRPELTLAFQRGPWHVRVSETSRAQGSGLLDSNVAFEHWIEVATVSLPRRRVPLEFFTLYFEDGFARAEYSGQIQCDEIVFLVDMILETLDLMPGVEPRDPVATA